mgnify:FL=1
MKVNTTFTKSILTSGAVTLLLSACGGGGGSSGTGNTPITPSIAKTQYPIEAAITSLNTSSFSKSLRYTDTKGVIYSIDFSSVPSGDTSFNGKAAKTATQTMALKVNGVAAGTSIHTFYFQINPFKVLGYAENGGSYVVAANQVALPTSSPVGSSGKFYTLTEYASNLSSLPVSTTVAHWSLEADTSSTAYFCITALRQRIHLIHNLK